MRISFVILSLIALVACEGAQLKEGQIDINRSSGSAGPGEANSGNGNSPTVASADNNVPLTNKETPVAEAPPSTSSAEMPMPDSAYIPVSIGGASLTCSVPDIHVALATCYAKNKNGGPFKFNATKAFFIDSKYQSWYEAAFIEVAPGAWKVKLPYKVTDKSFAIAFSNDASTFMMDWVANASDPLAKSIEDGSFENIVYDGTNATHFLDASHQKSWKAISKTKGCDSVIEIANATTMTDVGKTDGEQWIELDSACHADSYLSGGNNTIVYQDLLLHEDHVYEISFQYSGRPGRRHATFISRS